METIDYAARLNRFEEAERAFLDAGSLAPDNPWPCRDLARLYLSSRKNLARARELAQRAVNLAATAPNYFVLSWACEAEGDLPGALRAMEQAVELAPNDPELRRKYELLQSRQ